MNALNNDLPIVHTDKKSVVLLLLFFFVLYILLLGVRDLFVPDETRYAEISREMIAGGDWVVPHLNGVRYFEKPVLGYWVHAGFILLFGENNFAVRLPSAMAVGLSAFLIVMLIARAGRKEEEKWHQGGILAALAFLTCFGVFSVGNTAVLDNLFSFFLTATITAFYFATEAEPGSAMEKRQLLLSGVSCGLAFLTKGFLAFAVPVLALAPYLVWQRRYSDLFRMSVRPILAATLVALPWSVLIHLREPDFWRFFFWNEHIRRFMGDNAQHRANFWYFFVIAPGLFMPWTFMIPAATAGIKGNLRDQGPQGRLLRLSICWLLLPFLFFSFSSGKLITYILPCFPPFAILMVLGLLQVLNKERKEKIFQWGSIGAGIFFSLVLLAFVYVQLFGYHAFRLYSRPWKALMVVNVLFFMILFCFWAFRRHERITKIILFGLSPFLLFLTAPFILPDLTIEKKAPGILLERYVHDIGRDTIIISDEETVRAVCWYLKRTDVHVLGGGGELDYGLAYKDSNGRATDMRSAVDLINQNQGKILLIARVKNISRWRDQLPSPVFQDDSGLKGYGFRRY